MTVPESAEKLFVIPVRRASNKLGGKNSSTAHPIREKEEILGSGKQKFRSSLIKLNIHSVSSLFYVGIKKAQICFHGVEKWL